MQPCSRRWLVLGTHVEAACTRTAHAPRALFRTVSVSSFFVPNLSRACFMCLTSRLVSRCVDITFELEKPPSSPQGEVVQYVSLRIRVRGTHTRYRRDSFSANHKLLHPATSMQRKQPALATEPPVDRRTGYGTGRPQHSPHRYEHGCCYTGGCCLW